MQLKRSLFTFIIFFLSTFSYSQEDYSKVIDYYNKEQQFNGVALVATNGKIDFLGGIGCSNRQTLSKITPTTKFKIASITKTFTAILILKLLEKGQLDLDATIGTYIPNYKGNGKDQVTIRHLLTYSSGIPNTAEKYAMGSYKKQLTLDAYIDQYCSDDIVFTPGKQSNYSNTDYILLHKIIENITKQDFETVLQKNILKPLKMKNTGMLQSDSKIKGLTNSYSIDDSTKSIAPDEFYFIENYFGAGAMYSTVEDLLKFDQAIFNHQLLKAAITQLMLSPNEALGGVAFGVWYAAGYGTFDKPFIYRTGGILGACSNWIHSIEDKKTIIVFNNTNGTNLYELSEQLYLVSKGEKPSVLVK
jgi:CubicO group peptidase (beta-lactamase class C family)